MAAKRNGWFLRLDEGEGGTTLWVHVDHIVSMELTDDDGTLVTLSTGHVLRVPQDIDRVMAEWEDACGRRSGMFTNGPEPG